MAVAMAMVVAMAVVVAVAVAGGGRNHEDCPLSDNGGIGNASGWACAIVVRVGGRARDGPL